MTKKAVSRKSKVVDPLTKTERAKVQSDAIKEYEESGVVHQNSNGETFAPVPPEKLNNPKVAVLKKIMDVSESLEAVGKLKEFAASGEGELHRETSMAFESLGLAINGVESWLNVIGDIQKNKKKT